MTPAARWRSPRPRYPRLAAGPQPAMKTQHLTPITPDFRAASPTGRQTR